MKKISWCLKQPKGIELVEPNGNLASAYFKEADETLEQIKDVNSKWAVIMAYYAAYNSLYALLMQSGIKCEIHDCTIELMSLIKSFSVDDYNFLKKLKNKRIQNQYYLKSDPLDGLHEVKKFVFKCNEISYNWNPIELREAIDGKK